MQDGDCDKDGSAYDPASVDILFDNPEIVLRKLPDRDVVIEGPSAADLMGLSDEYYLDFPGNPKRPGCRYEEDYKRYSASDEPTIYAHVATEDGTDGIAVQYWFYYYFNDFANKHEGDWEMVQVMWDQVSTAEEALQQDPTRTVYSSHAGGELADWTDSKLRKIGDRPVVYVTTGSNASYYSEGIFMGTAKRGQVFGCDPTTGPHRDVDPAVVVLPKDPPDDPGSPHAWMSFAGLWGEQSEQEIFSGPQGPPVRPRWTGPFEYADQQRDFSDRIPENFLGIDPAGFICTAVNAGSEFMIFFSDYPWIVAGSVLIVVGLAGTMMVQGAPAWLVGPAGRATAGPEVLEPRPGFLRRHRSIRQIGRTAVRIYRLHWRLWLVTGAVMVPVAAVVMLIEQLLGLGWLEDAVDSSMAEPFSEIIGMTFGALVSATVVAGGVFASLRSLDEGEQPSVLSAYKHLLQRLADFALQTVAVGAALVALSVTLVGIPVAINRGVAWAVAGQAVVMEDRQPLDSMRRSGTLVSGAWWRTGLVLALIGLFIGLPGPLIAFACLIFLEPPVLQIVYPVLSALYVLVLFPLGFICSGLLYGDLCAEKESEGVESPAGD